MYLRDNNQLINYINHKIDQECHNRKYVMQVNVTVLNKV